MAADLTAPINGVLTNFYWGENTQLASLRAQQAGVSEAEANEARSVAQEYAGFAEEFSGPAYDTVPAGEAATTEGQFFRVPVDGTNPVEYTRYQRTAGGSVAVAPLATAAALASPDPGKGASLIMLESGNTVQDIEAAEAGKGASLVPFLPDENGAVARTVAEKLREFISGEDRGAVGDGSTDDRTKLGEGISAIQTTGGDLQLQAKTYYLGSPVTLSWSANLRGRGMAHDSYYNGGEKRGTVLEIASGTGQDCLTIGAGGGGRGGFGISDMSVFNRGSAAVKSVVRVCGILYPRLVNVEIGPGAGGADKGIGLLINRDSTNAITLYGRFSGVKSTGNAVGLQIEDDCNANTFIAGSFQGKVKAFHFKGTASYPVGNSFHGVAFEGVYSAAMEHEYIPPGTHIVGYPLNTAGYYVVKLGKVEKGWSTMFSGGYMELSGVPSTYNDGVNGSKTLVPVIEIGTEAVDTILDGVRLAIFVLDRGRGTQIRSTQPNQGDYWTKSPPTSIRRTNVATALPAFATTAIPFATIQTEDAARFSANAARTAITVAYPGKYRVHVCVHAGGMTGASDFNHVRITMGGQVFHGPACPTAGNVGRLGMTCTAEMRLNAGDTISAEVTMGAAGSAVVTDGTYNYLMIEQC